jgi:hypothetical protein
MWDKYLKGDILDVLSGITYKFTAIKNNKTYPGRFISR